MNRNATRIGLDLALLAVNVAIIATTNDDDQRIVFIVLSAIVLILLILHLTRTDN